MALNGNLALSLFLLKLLTVWKESGLCSSISKCCRFENVLNAGSTDGRLVHRADKITYWASNDNSFFCDKCFEEDKQKAFLDKVDPALIKRLEPTNLSGKEI